MVLTACLVIAVISSHLCSLINSSLTIQVPPQAIILSNAKYSVKLLVFIPPVGMNFKLQYGADIALIAGSPPFA